MCGILGSGAPDKIRFPDPGLVQQALSLLCLLSVLPDVYFAIFPVSQRDSHREGASGRGKARQWSLKRELHETSPPHLWYGLVIF